MRLQEKFKALETEKSALLAANFYNFETAKGIVGASAELGMPVILQASPATIEYLGAEMAAAIGRTLLERFGVEGWLHLDHAHSTDVIARCLDAGFDSVMIDASEQSLALNISITLEVVKMAESYGASVEAELGYVAKLGQSQGQTGFTEPDEARRFADATGINALAVAIGSAHGFYDREPDLDLERLSEIRDAVEVALVLHGCSGIPDSQLREGIRRGIRKINVATELKDCFMSALQKQLADTDEIDLRKVFPPATGQLTALVKEKLLIIKNA